MFVVGGNLNGYIVRNVDRYNGVHDGYGCVERNADGEQLRVRWYNGADCSKHFISKDITINWPTVRNG